MRYPKDKTEIDTRKSALEDFREYVAHLPRNVSLYRKAVNFLAATIMCFTDVRGKREEGLLEYTVERIFS